MNKQEKIEFLYGMKIVISNRVKREGNKNFRVYGYATIFTDVSRHWISEKNSYMALWSDIISALKPTKESYLSLDNSKIFLRNIQRVINHIKTQPNESTLY